MQTRRIPLFPLNVVLFPGMTLPLQIFEPRYQQMIQDCLREDRHFGVCLIRAGQEVGGPADPFPVGTTCEILSVEPMGEGRMLLATVGRERFRILRIYDDKPYREAEVELLPPERGEELGELPERVHDAALEYINALLSLTGESIPEVQLPQDPAALSYLVGAVLQVDLPLRQELLEDSRISSRLERQLALLERETQKLSTLEPSDTHVARPFHVDVGEISLN